MDDVVEELQVEGGIVVGHDGSKCAQEALTWAGRLARRADLDLHVVRAWSMLTAPRPSTWAAGYVPPPTSGTGSTRKLPSSGSAPIEWRPRSC